MKTNAYFALPDIENNRAYKVSNDGETIAVYTDLDAIVQARQHAASLNAAEWKRIQNAGPLTRYLVKGWPGFVTIDSDEAVRLCSRLRIAIESIETTAGVYLLDNTDGAIWSDGRITGKVHCVPALGLSKDIRRLVRAALRNRSEWDNYWQELLSVADAELTLIGSDDKRTAGLGWHSTNEVALYRVTSSNYPTIWLVTMAGGALGEDGDAWEDELLFANEIEARRQYQEWRK